MLETSDIEKKLKIHAEKISKDNNKAPVVIIVAGSGVAGITQCVTAWANLGNGRNGRLRDLIGILQTAIQIESLKHFNVKK